MRQVIPGSAHETPMQLSPRPFSRFLAIPLLAGIAVLGVAGSQPAPPDAVDPELREIDDEAAETTQRQ